MENKIQSVEEFSDESQNSVASWVVPTTTLGIGEISPKFTRPVQSTQTATTKIWRLPSHRDGFLNSKKTEEKLPSIGTTQLMKTSLQISGCYQNSSSTVPISGKMDYLTTEHTFTRSSEEKEYTSTLHSMKELLKMIDAVHQKKLKAGVEKIQELNEIGGKKPQVRLLIGRKYANYQKTDNKHCFSL